MITVNIGTKIRNGCTLKEKVHIFLEHIADPIIHNGEVFDNLLCILEESKLSGPQLAKDMRDQLTAKVNFLLKVMNVLILTLLTFISA